MNPTLTRGDSGEWVEYLQGVLHWLQLYEGKIDGAFGPMTAAAIRTFQEAAQLEVDEIVGPLTWAAIEATVGDRFNEPGHANEPAHANEPTAIDEAEHESDFNPDDWDVAILSSDGEVVGYGTRELVSRDGGVSRAEGAEEILLGGLFEGSAVLGEVADLPGEFLDALGEFIDAVRSVGGTGGFGFHIDVGLGAGATGGVGLYLSSSGEYGFYDTAGVDLGVITGVSGGMQVTLVEGGPSALAGQCHAVVVGVSLIPSLPISPSVGFSVLFTEPGWEFLGVAGMFGAGASVSPVDLYYQFSTTRIHSLGTL